MSASTQSERILVRFVTKTKRKRKKKIQTRNRKLVEKYPWLIPRNDWTGKIIDGYDYTWTELDGWPKGWVKAFGRVFADELGAALDEAGLTNSYRVFQVKEKYGCYDNKTEVLTKDGWKFFKDLSYEDQIATLNPKTNYLEYQYPTEIIAEHYHGKMYRLENRGISLCVTPNHNLYIAKGSYYNGRKNCEKRYYDFELCTPDKYFDKDKRFLKTCNWEGELRWDEFKIKGFEYETIIRKEGEEDIVRHYIKDGLSFNIIPWLRFLGFYVAEGYVVNKKNEDRRKEINIAFNPYTEHDLVEELITSIGFKPHFSKDNKHACFNSITLGEWLVDNCGDGALNKKVPNFIKELPPFYIEEFLTYLYIGDGHKTDTSNVLTTISKQLSDDVQELLLKAGYSFRETIRDRRYSHGFVGGHEIISRHITYEINWLQLPYIEIDMSKARKSKKFKETWIDYNKCVYCVTVPNHIIYIRRNGKGLWCGNSARWYDNGGTQKTHNIIRAFEYISERICYSCGKLDVPMINDGWYCPTCLECFKKNYRRREKWKMEHNPDYEPVSDEYLETLYAECIADEPDENGQYLIPMSYKVKTGYKETEKTIEYDISDIVNKIRKRS